MKKVLTAVMMALSLCGAALAAESFDQQLMESRVRPLTELSQGSSQSLQCLNCGRAFRASLSQIQSNEAYCHQCYGGN